MASGARPPGPPPRMVVVGWGGGCRWGKVLFHVLDVRETRIKGKAYGGIPRALQLFAPLAVVGAPSQRLQRSLWRAGIGKVSGMALSRIRPKQMCMSKHECLTSTNPHGKTRSIHLGIAISLRQQTYSVCLSIDSTDLYQALKNSSFADQSAWFDREGWCSEGDW